MESDRNSCVKNEKRELERKPWLLSHLRTAAQSEHEVEWECQMSVLESYRNGRTQHPLKRRWKGVGGGGLQSYSTIQQAVLQKHTGCLKVSSAILIQYTFRQIQRISPHSSLAFSSVRKKQSSVHIQPWLCKWQTNRVAGTEPPTRSYSQIVKYGRFVTTGARALKEHWRKECICPAIEFKYQQAFSRIPGYTFKSKGRVLQFHTMNEMNTMNT